MSEKQDCKNNSFYLKSKKVRENKYIFFNLILIERQIDDFFCLEKFFGEKS